MSAMGRGRCDRQAQESRDECARRECRDAAGGCAGRRLLQTGTRECRWVCGRQLVLRAGAMEHRQIKKVAGLISDILLACPLTLLVEASKECCKLQSHDHGSLHHNHKQPSA